MPLQSQLVPVQLTGLNTKVDAKIVIPTQFTDLQNAVFTSPGTLSKRNGVTSLPQTNYFGGSAVASAVSLASYGNELLLNDGSDIWSYVPSITSWVDKGNCPLWKTEITSVETDSYTASQATMCTASGLEFYAFVKDSSLYFKVRDSTSGAIARTTNLGNFIFPKVLAGGVGFYLFYMDTSGNIYCRIFNATTQAMGSATTIITNAHHSNTFYDVVADNATTPANFIVACPKVSVTTHVILVKMDLTKAVTLSADLVVDINSAINLCSLNNGTNYALTCAFATQKNVSLYLNSSLAEVTRDFSSSATTCYQITSWQDTTTKARLVFCSALIGAIYGNTIGAAGVSHPNSQQNCIEGNNGFTSLVPHALFARAFVIGNYAYLPVLFQSSTGFTYTNYFGTYFLVRVPKSTDCQSSSDAVPVAKSSSELLSTNGTGTQNKFLSDFSLSGSTYTTAVLVRDSLSNRGAFSASGHSTTSIGISKLGWSPITSQITPITTNGVEIFPASITQSYDGNAPCELGFNVVTSLYNSEETPHTSGGSMADGSYQYSFVYEFLDSQNNLWQSNPREPFTTVVTGGSGSGSVTVEVETLKLTSKKNYEIVIYRTLDAGTTFYRITAPGAFVIDPTAGFVAPTITFLDTLTDAIIQNNQVLYTTGEVLENTPAPPCTFGALHRNRIFLGGLEDPRQMAYSRSLVEQDGINFNGDLQVVNDESVTSLGSLDSALAIFGPQSAYVLVGNGPTDTGAQNDYVEPSRVSVDYGCSYPASVVRYPDGLMFKSAKGIASLDRAFRPAYVGAEVEAYNTNTVTGAHVVSSQNQVRFLSSGSNNPALIRDYFVGQWGTFTSTLTNGYTGVASCIWNGAYCYVQSNGKVFVEGATYVDDGSAFISMSWTTSWFKPGNVVMGYQRVWELLGLGAYKSAHVLNFVIDVDFDAQLQRTATFDPATAMPLGAAESYQFRLGLPIQKCEALRVRVYDSLPALAVAGEGYSFSGLTLNLGVKGSAKISAAKSIG